MLTVEFSVSLPHRLVAINLTGYKPPDGNVEVAVFPFTGEALLIIH